MKVKEMINMLKQANPNSLVTLEVRERNWDLMGYFEIGSDWIETGGYDPDELLFHNTRDTANVELTIGISEWDKIWQKDKE